MFTFIIIDIIIMAGLAMFFYKAAEFEDLSFPIIWPVASILLWLGAIFYLHWGYWASFALQLLLFLLMTGVVAYNANHDDLSLAALTARRRPRIA